MARSHLNVLALRSPSLMTLQSETLHSKMPARLSPAAFAIAAARFQRVSLVTETPEQLQLLFPRVHPITLVPSLVKAPVRSPEAQHPHLFPIRDPYSHEGPSSTPYPKPYTSRFLDSSAP